MSEVSPQIFKYFSDLIKGATGIQYSDNNIYQLISRLNELAKTSGFQNIDAFWQAVQTRGLLQTEREMLLDLATNNETSFFRDLEVFNFFKDDYIPNHTKPGSTIKIWSAACSTGQEPYSLAMILSELRELGYPRAYSILATDISERVLNRAQTGIYSQLEIQRGLPAKLLVRFFEELKETESSAPQFRVRQSLRDLITFKRLNLLDPWPDQGPFDIIFCRNVLIYQDVDGKRGIIKRLTAALAPEGFLVLGGAESLVGLSSEYEQYMFNRTCLYKRKPVFSATA